MVCICFVCKTRDKELGLVISICYSFIRHLPRCDVSNNLSKCELLILKILDSTPDLLSQTSVHYRVFSTILIDSWIVSWSNKCFASYSNTSMSLNFLVWPLMLTSAFMWQSLLCYWVPLSLTTIPFPSNWPFSSPFIVSLMGRYSNIYDCDTVQTCKEQRDSTKNLVWCSDPLEKIQY